MPRGCDDARMDWWENLGELMASPQFQVWELRVLVVFLVTTNAGTLLLLRGAIRRRAAHDCGDSDL